MMESKLQTYVPILARVLLALIFVMSGVGKIGDFGGTTEYMAKHGMPIPALFLVGAIVFELAGGLSIMTGFKARWGALLLIVFLIPATFIFHAFWTYEPDAQRMQMINFMKNLSILGGLLLIVARGAGPLSVDARLNATR